VAVFRRDGDTVKFEKLVSTTSAPLSIDFGNDHMYVAGATTVDSFVLHQQTVAWLDGTTGLELVGGATPPNGSTAQVGVIDDRQLLVTLKAPSMSCGSMMGRSAAHRRSRCQRPPAP
jgi:hypothetical protein